MHQIIYTIRRILPEELPSQDPQELLSAGIAALGNDLYSCVHQIRRDPETLQWSGDPHPGTVVTEGSQKARHAQLPAEVRAHVMRAQIIQGAAPVATANLAEVTAYLGDTTLDLSLATEAQRLAALPDNGIDRVVVPMAAVTSDDVLELDNLVPHAWAGESAH